MLRGVEGLIVGEMSNLQCWQRPPEEVVTKILPSGSESCQGWSARDCFGYQSDIGLEEVDHIP